MEYIMKLLTVFGLWAVELWAAIPAGFILQLHPLETGIAAATGAILSMLIVLKLGESMRTILIHKRNSEDKKHGRIYRIWDRYGVEGLGMLDRLGLRASRRRGIEGLRIWYAAPISQERHQVLCIF